MLPNTWHETTREFIENREKEVVNNYSQYCSVVKTGIGNTNMILGGEVDASKCPLNFSDLTSTNASQYGIPSPLMVALPIGWNLRLLPKSGTMET